MTRDDFIIWEQASRDTIDVKRCYIDVADDLAAGVLLSQFIFYFLPDGDGSLKSCIVERGGELWIAKKREEWWKECRLSPDQYDRACGKLEGRGIIKMKRFKLTSEPVKHVALLWKTFFDRLEAVLKNPPKQRGQREMELADSRNEIPVIREMELADSRKPSLSITRDIRTADSMPESETTPASSSRATGSAKSEEEEKPGNEQRDYDGSTLPIPVPDPFPLTAEARTWAAENYPLVDLEDETDRFISRNNGSDKKHPKPADVPLDEWQRRWRVWIRRGQKFAERDAASPAPQTKTGNGDATSTSQSRKESSRAAVASFRQKQSNQEKGTN